jgi:hypothetical protein
MRRLRDFWFGQADLAPVALFRVIYGVQLFNWFWQLYPNLTAFFTDEGILPRQSLVQFFPDRFTLLALGGAWWQVALFWVACLFVAAMLAVGWHTRTASILAFLGVTSFMWRQPLMLDGSDIVFRLIPFWLAFTNAGDLYSIDAARRRERGDVPGGSGPALPVRVLELQVAWIYLMTGLEKLGGTQWLGGIATYFALQLEHTFGRGYAYPLTTMPLFMNLMSWGTLVIELVFLPIAMLPFRATRLLAVALGVMLHAGILTLMNVGNFPVIMLSTLVLFLPPDWVRSFVARVEGAFGRRLAPRVSAFAAEAVREAPRLRAARAPTRVANARPGSVALDRVVAGAALVLAMALAFATALPERLSAYRPQGELASALRWLSLDQRWDMFSPNPAHADGWMLGPATLVDGTTYDLFTRGPVNTEPRWTDPLYTRWVKIFERMANKGYADYRLEFGRALCRTRNFHIRPGESPLDTFELVYVERVILPPGEGEPLLNEYRIWSHKC